MQYGGKQWVGVDFPPIYGDDKAVILSVANGKFRVAFMSKVSMNGQMNWDFKNKNGINLSFQDGKRFVMMLKTMVKIYLDTKTNPSIVSTNPLYSATHLTMPIMNAQGTPYGHMAVGMNKSPNDPNEVEFWIGYKTTSNEGTVVQEVFHFKNAVGKGGEINFFADGTPGSDNNPIGNQYIKHAEFANFITWSELLVNQGPYIFAQESNAYYRGTRSYQKKDNRQPDYNKGGAMPDPDQGNSFPQDIPF